MRISSTVKGFFGLDGGFLGCGVGFSTRGAAGFGAIGTGLLTDVAGGFGDIDESGVMLISGVASTVGSGVVSLAKKLVWFEFVWFDSSGFGVCKNQTPKVTPPNIKKIKTPTGKSHEV